ncbi:MAG: peptidoglycan endopeptidase [Verrucomicrobiota bacterium]
MKWLALASMVALSGCRTSEPYSYQFDYGKSVILRNGYAVAPKSAPAAVHRVVAAGNRIQGMPYKYGGGHLHVDDTGYDCSGTVSYALIKAGLLESTMPSKGFKNYGKKGDGKWITVYAKDGHTFLTVGGLRLDTGYRGQGRGPTWTTRNRPTSGYKRRHPAGL